MCSWYSGGFFSPVHGAFHEAVLGPPLTAGALIEGDLEPRLRGFSMFPFSDGRLKPNSENGRERAFTGRATALPAVNGGPITAAAASPVNGANGLSPKKKMQTRRASTEKV